jgi:hypothetical protein
MISNEKIAKNKVVELIGIYNFGFDYFFIRVRLSNLKFEFQNMRIYKEFWTVNGSK